MELPWGLAAGVLVGLRGGAMGVVLAAGLGGRLQLQLQPQLRCLSAQSRLWWRRVWGGDGKSCLELLECEMYVDPMCSTQRLGPGLRRG